MRRPCNGPLLPKTAPPREGVFVVAFCTGKKGLKGASGGTIHRFNRHLTPPSFFLFLSFSLPSLSLSPLSLPSLSPSSADRSVRRDNRPRALRHRRGRTHGRARRKSAGEQLALGRACLWAPGCGGEHRACKERAFHRERAGWEGNGDGRGGVAPRVPARLHQGWRPLGFLAPFISCSPCPSAHHHVATRWHPAHGPRPFGRA